MNDPTTPTIYTTFDSSPPFIPTPVEPASPPPPERRRLPMMLFLLIFLLGLLMIPWLSEEIAFTITRGEERAKAEIARKLLGDLPDPNQRIAWVAKAAGPSVVGIRTWTPLGRGNYGEGGGTGVVVDPDGFILTNNHVIANIQAISIQMSDGRTFDKAYIVGQDTVTDIAVLKIDASNLTPMPWGDSRQSEIGDEVVAIGNPFGLEHTVTSGIISAKERYNPLADSSKAQVYLQTDAAINPGNSGGPLVNLRGQLIGINTAIIGEAYQGIGFAIPSVLAKRVYEEIRKYGKMQHGWLGIYMRPMTQQLAESMGLDKPKGVFVDRFLPHSPAQDAGMKTNDLIVRWNDEEIRDPLHLMHTIILSKPNTTVDVEVLRDGKPVKLRVAIGTRPVSVQ